MTTGLQTFDQQGNIIIDLTTKLGRYMGYRDVTDGNKGSINVPIPVGMRPFYSVIPLALASPYGYPADVKFHASGLLEWDYLGNLNSVFGKTPCRIVYGYY